MSGAARFVGRVLWLLDNREHIYGGAGYTGAAACLCVWRSVDYAGPFAVCIYCWDTGKCLYFSQAKYWIYGLLPACSFVA